MSGLREEASFLLEQEANKYLDSYQRQNKKMLLVCHSNGGTHVYNYLNKLTDPYQQCFIALPVASATPITKKICAGSTPFASKKDPIPRLRPILSQAGYFLNLVGQAGQDGPLIQPPSPLNLRETTFLSPHPQARGIDHSFDSPTFKHEVKASIVNYITKTQNFYE